jgi:hypothetical protein
MNDRPIGVGAPECTPGNYTSMRLVDSVPNLVGSNNLLFRGGMPLDSCGNFDLAGLDAAFRKLYAQTPEQYYLVDISLVFDGENGLSAERKFLRNPDPDNDNKPNKTGQLVWWPTYGSLRCYYQTDPGERDRLVRTFDEWLPDTLIRRTETLRYMLETSWAPGPTPYDPGYNLPGNPCPPCVFYVHCSGGCDRTSELIGAYRLRYQGFNWLEMNKELPCCRPDPSSSLPSMGCSNYRALQWYAIWLNRTFGFALAPYGDTGCYDGGQQPWHPCSPSAQVQQ